MIGVDLGGTNVRAQAIWPNGTVAGRRKAPFSLPSRGQEGTDAIIEAVSTVIRQAAESAKAPVLGVGLAIPGMVDNRKGMIRWAPNFGQKEGGVFVPWEDVPVRELLEAAGVAAPIFMGNDANLAALGEYDYGIGKGTAACLVMLTLGTGIGGGVVMGPSSVQGRASGPLLLLGGNQGGAELGHVMVNDGGPDSSAGGYGTIEAYCQRDAIVRRAQLKLVRGRASLLFDLCHQHPGRITPLMISQAADLGDEVALEVWSEVGHYLGLGIGNFINIFAPDKFAIGGQIAKAGQHLLQTAVRSASAVAVPALFRDCEIRLAQQIDRAGILGGAALAVESLKLREA